MQRGQLPAQSGGRPGRPLDPAEAQADDLGARIGEHLGGGASVGPGGLPDAIRGVAEQHLGTDLSNVRLHVDAKAERRAQEMQEQGQKREGAAAKSGRRDTGGDWGQDPSNARFTRRVIAPSDE